MPHFTFTVRVKARQLTSTHFTTPESTTPTHLTIPHHTSSHFTSSRLTVHLTSNSTPPHLNLHDITSPDVASPRTTHLEPSHLISPQLTSSHLTSLHLTSPDAGSLLSLSVLLVDGSFKCHWTEVGLFPSSLSLFLIPKQFFLLHVISEIGRGAWSSFRIRLQRVIKTKSALRRVLYMCYINVKIHDRERVKAVPKGKVSEQCSLRLPFGSLLNDAACISTYKNLPRLRTYCEHNSALLSQQVLNTRSYRIDQWRHTYESYGLNKCIHTNTYKYM